MEALAAAKARKESQESRLGRIEAFLESVDRKLDRIAEEGAVARTDIAWLKWATRLLFAAVLGVGGLTVGQMAVGIG